MKPFKTILWISILLCFTTSACTTAQKCQDRQSMWDFQREMMPHGRLH